MRKPFYLLAALALLGAAACSGASGITGATGRTTSAPTHDENGTSGPNTNVPPDTTGRGGGGTLGSGG
jgi:hypothetical protein